MVVSQLLYDIVDMSTIYQRNTIHFHTISAM
jgi:hypothetical protein